MRDIIDTIYMDTFFEEAPCVVLSFELPFFLVPLRFLLLQRQSSSSSSSATFSSSLPPPLFASALMVLSLCGNSVDCTNLRFKSFPSIAELGLEFNPFLEKTRIVIKNGILLINFLNCGKVKIGILPGKKEKQEPIIIGVNLIFFKYILFYFGWR